jgi:hypothetical protein
LQPFLYMPRLPERQGAAARADANGLHQLVPETKVESQLGLLAYYIE